MKESYKIIFEDDYLIGVSKLGKLLVHPASKGDESTLTTVLAKKMGYKVYPCHRLDRETTGILLYAKDKKTEQSIMNQFRNGLIQKEYLALVKGRMKKFKGVLESMIIDKQGAQHGEKEKNAKTIYRVIKFYGDFSLVKLRPLTGRTHQLRIQLAEIGHPILGERTYAFGRDFKVKFRRLALHACFLSFNHPLSSDRVDLKADLPYDMQDLIKSKTDAV